MESKNLDELNAQLLDAKVELKAKQDEARTCYESLKEHLTKVLESNILPSMAKVSVRESGAQVKVGSNREFDLYFDKPWHHEENGKTRSLKLNFGCFGSFSKDDADEVQYCKVLGHVAGIMDILEMQLFKTDEAKRLWDKFDSAQHAMYNAADNERRISGEIQDIETAARKEKILAQVIPGCRIVVNKASPWRNPVIKTIEHITSKNILFKEDWGRRTKKDELISNLMCNRWEIA